MIKKVLICLTTTLAILTASLGVSAAKVGDVIDYTRNTDIVATIDGYDIACFNLNGYTYVVAENLRDFGFTVAWSEASRELNISKVGDLSVDSEYITPVVPEELLGKVCHEVLYTDIVTYIDGSKVQSYNIGGQTIIPFNELYRFGNIEYNDNARRLTLDLYDSGKKADYDKVLAGDLSDFAGVYENAFGDRIDLRHDGTEGYQYDSYEDVLYKGIAGDFHKYDDGHYDWSISFEYDGYAMWLYPAGVEVYSYEGKLIPTDASVVRLYAGHDFYSDSEMPARIYYPIGSE